MKPIPTDPIGLIIWLIDLGLVTVSIGEAADRLRTGISATATKEGREVTEEELALIKAVEAESDRRRRGE